jgi:hypothetical protein
LSDEINQYKQKVEEFSRQAADSSMEHNNSSSLENLELRKRLEDAEYKILQMQQSSGEVPESFLNNQILIEEEDRKLNARAQLIEFLRESLRKISSLEENVDNLQVEANLNASRL